MTFKICGCLDFKIGQILIQMVYLSTECMSKTLIYSLVIKVQTYLRFQQNIFLYQNTLSTGLLQVPVLAITINSTTITIFQ